MPLIEFWKSNHEAVLSMSLDRVVTMAGNGILADGNETSKELKEFFSEIEPEKLAEYAKYCLEKSFEKSGYVLQDVINEIAKRLDFSVMNGRYQGVRNEIGYDGIWQNGHENFVIEIKTTDAYLIDLDGIAKYKEKLIETNVINKNSYCLIVIGRNEKQSKALEMQLRGSIHAWSMRIISIDALIKLMIVNSSTSSLEVTEKIHTILKPFEYIKVDKIVDVLFTVTEEKIVEEEIFAVTENQSDSFENFPKQNSNQIIQKKRIENINRFSIHLGVNLVKRRKTFYADQSGETLVAIAISKKYETSNPGYWYGYHLRQFNYLSQGKSSFMLFGMLDRNEVYAIPFHELEQYKQKMDITESEGRDKYWHVRIFEKPSGLFMRFNDGTEIDLKVFQI